MNEAAKTKHLQRKSAKEADLVKIIRQQIEDYKV